MNRMIMLGGVTAVLISGAAVAQTPSAQHNPQVKPPLADERGDLSDKLQRNDGVIKPPAVDSNMPTPRPPHKARCRSSTIRDAASATNVQVANRAVD